MKYKWANWLLLLLCLVLAVNIVRVWLNLSRRGDVIKKAEERWEKTKNDNETLKRELARVQSKDYIERQARDKLNLGKEGEIVVLLPSISPIESPTPTPIDESANWEKWVRVFVK